ncbi:ABC transporter ATP-binding protein [Amycolatopsis jiangsuensis]|uniref:ABC-2 type transport system ATP-binding protein n=1 Tax=Amycolatopsis jiangsuensis TaxID=1181879 RepID=A0A840IRR3_9PSEU|nr:ABC transporter ATP-binding protein [Amycolatopsis jiangsuensis]MBB4684125.1 ABC-2 type transport system ATP-binding protein [Amycolatopsis jiangsuensis]
MLSVRGLGRRFGSKRALRDCSFTLPEGRVSALVGPNGAGKSTLLSLVAGLLLPSEGTITVADAPVRGRMHPDVAFLAQSRPLYGDFTVAETLRAGAKLNDRWSDEYARQTLNLLSGVALDRRIRQLSAGERTQVALAVAFGRLPKLLLLDEPLSDLDPLARDETLRILMADVAERGTTVLVSSHLLTDLSPVCDHLVLLDRGELRLAGDVEDTLHEHRLLVGPAGAAAPAAEQVIEANRTGRQAMLLVRGAGTVPAEWEATVPELEQLVLAYLRASRTSARPPVVRG